MAFLQDIGRLLWLYHIQKTAIGQLDQGTVYLPNSDKRSSAVRQQVSADRIARTKRTAATFFSICDTTFSRRV
jgi:hypothetical protein